jgi:ribonucleoside-diphosphate reductase alpha chain
MSGKKIDIRVSPNAMTVLKRRYLMKDAEGRVIETPHDLFVRVANFIAEADRPYGAFMK